MQPGWKRLLKEYEALPPLHQSVLEVLSVASARMGQRVALRCVKAAGVRDSQGKPILLGTWRKIIEDLSDRNLLTTRDWFIECNEEIADSVARGADRKGTLLSCVRATEGAGGTRSRRSDEEYSYFYYYYEPDTLIVDLRLSAHLNHPAAFTSKHAMLLSEFSDDDTYFDVMERLFNRPFDADWLGKRAQAIREIALGHVLPRAHDRLAPADDAAGMLEEVVAKEGEIDWRRKLIVEHHLLKGDLATSSEWIPRDGTPESAVLLGRQLCVCGEYQKAVGKFEGAIALTKKATRKRDIFFDAIDGAFYVVALLGTRDAKKLRQAVKYIGLALRKMPGASPLYESLLTATEVADGKRKASVHRRLLDIAGDLPALHQIFIFSAACWADKGEAKRHVKRIEGMLRTAKSGRYGWAAAEFSGLRARLRGGAGLNQAWRSQHKRLGTASLLNAMPEEQSWKRGLRALSRLSDKVGANAARSSTSRLVWRVDADANPPALRAYEQKLSKTGRWSKGRAVALKRLHARENLGFMTLRDERACQEITEVNGSRVTYKFDAGGALAALAGHPLVFRADDPTTRMEVVRAEPQLRVETVGRKVKIRLVPDPPADGSVIVNAESPTRLVVTPFDESHWEILEVVGRKGLRAPTSSRDEVVKAVSSVSALVTVHSDIGGAAAEKEVEADSTPRFHLTPLGSGLRVEPLVRPFASEGPAYPPGKGGEVVFSTIGGRQSMARRRLKEERSRHRQAIASCKPLQGSEWDGSGWLVPDPVECLELLDHLHSLGDQAKVAWPKGETMRIQDRASAKGLSLKIRKKPNWFAIDGELKLDTGRVISLMELLERIGNAKGRFLTLGDKGFVALSDRFRRQAEELAALLERSRKGLQFHDTRAPALEAIFEEAGKVDADSIWKRRLKLFREAQALDPVVPSTLRADLRDYQIRGFQWAARLAAWGAGACLADDMGLGKTLQALAVALARAPQGPTLVVAPTSVCMNWIEEARRFAPTLTPVQFGHGDRQETVKAAGPFQLIVCSYGLLHLESELLASVKWQMIVLDEAQAIKNQQTMRSKAAKRLAGEFRMITTGTPIENHLGELWNLFDFINPGLLGSSQSFNRKFASPIHNRQSDSAKRQLKRLIRPFILRRTKAAVLDELPARTDITVRVEMTQPEQEFYEAVRSQAVSRVAGEPGDNGRSHLRILAEITRLRRACCHPRLLAPDIDIVGSKLGAFSEIVADLIDNGHKALVFSQFVDHLSIVRARLDEQGVSYRYLDGSTPAAERKRQVDAFQSGDGSLFLISLRAGGQGLNLTAADYVLHLDPWWNPAVEDQASDRAHRIGQTRPVTIYRLVLKGTIEERIVDLHGAKRDLADSLLDGSDMTGKMSADELLALLREH